MQLTISIYSVKVYLNIGSYQKTKQPKLTKNASTVCACSCVATKHFLASPGARGSCVLASSMPAPLGLWRGMWWPPVSGCSFFSQYPCCQKRAWRVLWLITVLLNFLVFGVMLEYDVCLQQCVFSSSNCLLVVVASPNDPFSAETFVILVMWPAPEELKFLALEGKEWCATLMSLMPANWGLSGAPCDLAVVAWFLCVGSCWCLSGREVRFLGELVVGRVFRRENVLLSSGGLTAQTPRLINCLKPQKSFEALSHKHYVFQVIPESHQLSLDLECGNNCFCISWAK